MAGYRDAVGDATLPAELRTLQAALVAAGRPIAVRFWSLGLPFVLVLVLVDTLQLGM